MEDNFQAQVEARIKQVLISRLEIKPDILVNSSSDTPLFGRGIGLDSIEAMALIIGIEEEFDIHVEDEDVTVDLFTSIGTLAAYVLQKATE